MNSFNRLKLFIAIFALTIFAYGCGNDQLCCPHPVERYAHDRPVGSSAQDFLSASDFTILQVEIDYMAGHKPTQAGLDSLKTFLQRRLNKQAISFELTEIPSGDKKAYTISDIRSLEREHRDNFTQKGGETLHSYFLMVDGEYENSNVIGVAYWNTSLAIFGKTIEDISAGLTAPPEDKIEGTVFRHEFGHLMGLVGNGTPTQSNHKTSGSAHCTTDGCLMNPAVETANFFANIFDGDIPNLKQFCIEDLQNSYE